MKVTLGAEVSIYVFIIIFSWNLALNYGFLKTEDLLSYYWDWFISFPKLPAMMQKSNSKQALQWDFNFVSKLLKAHRRLRVQLFFITILRMDQIFVMKAYSLGQKSNYNYYIKKYECLRKYIYGSLPYGVISFLMKTAV